MYHFKNHAAKSDVDLPILCADLCAPVYAATVDLLYHDAHNPVCSFYQMAADQVVVLSYIWEIERNVS